MTLISSGAMDHWTSPRVSATKLLCSLQLPSKANFLKQAEQFEDDYNDNNYSNYVKDVSVHAVTNIRLGCGD
jgi:hypothetical protein